MSVSDLASFILQRSNLTAENRPIRLRLAHSNRISSGTLMPQKIFGSEAICGGLEYRVLCVSLDARLPLKEMIALPAAIEFVTDRGNLRTVCGIVTEASSGDSDGGVATYQLVVRDALAIMEKRSNTRIFRNANELDIVETILAEWRQSNSIMAAAFDRELDANLNLRAYPKREFTMQHNESDAAFIRRILKRAGIAWHFRSGRSNADAYSRSESQVPAHTMVLFDRAEGLKENAAATVRFHRDDATEQRDTILSWGGIRSLSAASVMLHSWDYKSMNAGYSTSTSTTGRTNQGTSGNEMAASLDDYHVMPPHIGNDHNDLCRIGYLHMSRHEMEAKCFRGEGTVRDFTAGEYFKLTGHPEIDFHPDAEREFVITTLQFTAENNLPSAQAQKLDRLFARSRWNEIDATTPEELSEGSIRFRVQFTAVRRGIPIVPAYEPANDLPRPEMQSVIVVGPPGEEVHCDELGRVKVRFPGTRITDHEHAHGVGASDSDADSAWVRIARDWAGSGPGSMSQCGTLGLPRAGSEGLVAFLGGDPDKPIMIGQLYNHLGEPPALSPRGGLPGNRYLSGIKSREINGRRGNQLRFDDTPKQISAQLSSDDGASQLNLGWLTQPRADGRGEPRGEGAELRSDKAVAVRGGAGVLVTATASNAHSGAQLDRSEMVDLADALRDLAEQLSKLAVTHSADAVDGQQLPELITKLKNLHIGSNVQPGQGAGAGAQPIVGVTAPAGVIITSEQSLMVGARENVDIISAGNSHLIAGDKTLIRAAEGISQFANEGGIKSVAARGKILTHAQDDSLELLAKKVLEIISTTEWINIKAKQGVRIYGGGSELEISEAGIIGYTTGKSHVHAADHQTFPKQARPMQFPGEIPFHDICVPCLFVSSRAHAPFAKPQ